jgi:hypothetical protein
MSTNDRPAFSCSMMSDFLLGLSRWLEALLLESWWGWIPAGAGVGTLLWGVWSSGRVLGGNPLYCRAEPRG